MGYRPLTFRQKARIAWIAVTHPRTPLGAKGALAAAVLYGLLPLDAIPDVLPLVGSLDDLAVVIAACVFFLRVTRAIRGEIAHREGL